MEKVKQEILNRDEKLRKRLIKTLALLGITLCVVVASGKTCEIKSKNDLMEVIEKYSIEELRFYSRGIEVDVESLKKQQKFYENFGKESQEKYSKKTPKTNTTYNKKVTTKQIKYHRKG